MAVPLDVYVELNQTTKWGQHMKACREGVKEMFGKEVLLGRVGSNGNKPLQSFLHFSFDLWDSELQHNWQY